MGLVRIVNQKPDGESLAGLGVAPQQTGPAESKAPTTNKEQMMKYARVPFALNRKFCGNIVILADTDTDPLVWEVMFAAACQEGADPTVLYFTPREFHMADPPSTVLAAMSKADLCQLLTSKGILHSPGIHHLMTSGVPMLACEQLTASMLTEGGATADYQRMHEIGYPLQKIWNEGHTVHVTSEAGTDITASIEGRWSWLSDGIVKKHEGLDLYNASFPTGEVGVAPVEETIEGTVVWDTSMHHIGLISQPISATVRGGQAVAFHGGAQAKKLEEYLKTYGDANSFTIAEISIGLNPNAKVTGLVREDKKLLGSVHIALGMNTDTGGVTESKTHVDGIIRYPTVHIDGKLIVDKGHIKE
jgi:hypothetical protein